MCCLCPSPKLFPDFINYCKTHEINNGPCKERRDQVYITYVCIGVAISHCLHCFTKEFEAAFRII